ncbi:MAG: tandem-95 repeat protein [Zoogloea sp.]|nr:tandem-95 repeat protein [Zoogloea sp.]
MTLNVLGNDSDPDGDTLTVTSATVDPAKGSVSINPDGTLAFNPAPNFNGPVEITYAISDGMGGSATSTVTVNVTPANDAPLAVNDSATTTEDSPVSRTPATGVLTNDSDIDSPSLTVSGVRTGTSGAFTAPGAAGVTLTGTYGALLIRADGSYTYTPGTAAQALNTGDSVQDVFSYQLSDGSLTATANLSITVTGANDAAVITGLATGSVKEDTAGQLTATGTLAATDVDSPATFTPASASGTYGSFNIAADGTWTYVLNNTAGNVQALNEGDSRTETFTVTTADGTPRNVTVTVLGTNETPTVANVTASGAEDPATPIPVTLTGADVDGAVTSLTLADLPANGTLYRDAAMTQPVTAGTPLAATAGAVTLYFQPAPNWNGSTSFHFTATDNNGGSSSQATASINVTPVTDTAQLGTGSGTVKEDTPAQSTASGTLSIVDPDAGEAVFQAQTGVPGTYGNFSINPAGDWTYTIDNTLPLVQALKEGETRNESFTVLSADGTSTTVSLTILGTNDGPVANPSTATTPEETPVTLNVLGNDSDPDGDTLTVTQATVDSAKGSVSINPDGTLAFNPAPNFNGPVEISYAISDGKGGSATSTVTVNVTPLPDTAQLGTGSGTVKEDTPAQSTASGTLSIVDPDAGEAVFQAQTGVAGTYGSFSINPAGDWTYTINNTLPLVQALKEGETRNESFTVLSADGTATTVSLTIVGTNDGPVANPSTATTPEDQPVTVNVLGNDSDPDGDTLTVTSATVDPAKGSVTVNPDGSLTFNPAANTNGPVVVTYTISDGKGGSATSTVTVNVTPANDAPLAVNDSATTTEDSPVSRTPATGVLTNDSDIDSPSLTVSGVRTGTSGAFTAPGAAGVTLTGTYGALLIRADGSYTYTPGTAAQALNTGDSVQDVFSYQLSDGSLTATANLSITVTGANDAAVITGLATGSVKEDTAGQLTATGTLAATDVDSPATFTPASASGTTAASTSPPMAPGPTSSTTRPATSRL